MWASEGERREGADEGARDETAHCEGPGEYQKPRRSHPCDRFHLDPGAYARRPGGRGDHSWRIGH